MKISSSPPPPLVQQPYAGQGRVLELVGLLRTRDRPVAEIST
jgi:hypothetical protein